MKTKRFPGHTVGVTGGIGSGKSTVCHLFTKLGRPVIAADPLARELMEQDPNLSAQIRTLLGEESYGRDGRLNRPFIASAIFSDAKLRQKVNGVVHPAVRREIGFRLLALPAKTREPYVIIEAALMFDSGLDRLLERVIVVDAPLEIRIARVMARDGTSRQDVLRRAAAQLDPGLVATNADIVIGNGGDSESLRARVAFVDRLLVSFGHFL